MLILVQDQRFFSDLAKEDDPNLPSPSTPSNFTSKGLILFREHALLVHPISHITQTM
jgi:hypothetical protein